MRILIVTPAWVGDLVMADALLQVLRQRMPAARLHLLAPTSVAALAPRLPGIETVHTLAAGHGELAIGARRRIARHLRTLAFDWAIVLPNSLKSALVPWLARIPRRTGWLGEQRYGLLNDYRRLDPRRYPLQVERFVALALPAGETIPDPCPRPRLIADADRGRELANRLGITLDRPVSILCPGAEFGLAKRWPAEHYAAVARAIQAKGGQVWLMGSPGDVQVCDDIRDLADAGALHQLAGLTRLDDAVDLICLAERVVCNDSGLMHVAAALDVPVIAIYGSTSPAFTPPMTEHATILRLGLPCSPCFQRECPLGHLDCLRRLAPERVTDLL